MSDDSQTTFSNSAENEILSQYNSHCAICLSRLPQTGIQAASFFDSSTLGLRQVGIIETSPQAGTEHSTFLRFKQQLI
jgi:hypothetical protein